MSESESDGVASAKQYLQENLAVRVSLDELAARVGLSRFHFARKFKREVGVTPLQYHLRQRIERATELLKDGKASVEVAKLLGFSDDSHFSRHFSRITGQTPGSVEKSAKP